MRKFQRKILFYLATSIGWMVMLLLGKLTRIQVVEQQYWNQLKATGKGFLVVLWHGRIFLPIYFHRRQKAVAMVSTHDDGEMIARTIHKLGFTTVRGSSTRGGGAALREMVRALKAGSVGTMMPDGPRGPRHHFKEGALYIAQLAGVPVLPMTFSAEHFVQFKSWDQFILVKPFSRAVIMYGEPIEIPPRFESGQKEVIQQELEKRLIELENKADEFFRK
jgi:lysophospholipid acyltransferase (LPLAT)-like uncharacterized protein